jgi:hypothetical protein
MSSSSKNASETNANQQKLGDQQAATQAAVLGAQTGLATKVVNAIVADHGNDSANLPTPSGLPSVAAVLGPSEEAVISASNVTSVAHEATDFAGTLAASQATVLATLGSGANGGALPLGPQYTSIPVYDEPSTSTTAPTSSGGGVVLVVVVAIVGGGAFILLRHK